MNKNSFCGDEKDDVISYVSAIANMEGGYLVIGVMCESMLKNPGIQKQKNFNKKRKNVTNILLRPQSFAYIVRRREQLVRLVRLVRLPDSSDSSS